MTISVIIIVKNRHDHLKNLLTGLNAAIIKTNKLGVICETIVVHMNEDILPTPPDYKNYISIKLDHKAPLPLAAARNKGAEIAIGDYYIFLDVDCIPDENLILDYANFHRNHPNSIAMGSVYYLPQTFPEKWMLNTLPKYGEEHSARKYLKNATAQIEDKYSFFWSLNFGLSKQTFENTGGFDEDYTGYGAEDTDFSQRARFKKISLYWVKNANAYHQYHTNYNPPFQHFDDIIRNSTFYKNKWGTWPMQKWLQPFNDLGFIQWNETSDVIEIVKKPTKHDIDNAQL